MRFILVISACFVLSCAYVAAGSKTNETEESNEIAERGNEIVDKALVPVYDLVKFFLEDIVQPNDLTYMEEKGVDFSDPDDISDSFVYSLEDWIWYFFGYAVLVAIGVILILVMGCACCCTCMCRTCCGKCGGKVQPIPIPNPGESDPERCKRACCSVSLFIVLTVVLLGSLTMYFTAVRIHSELTTEDGLFYSVSDGLTMIDDYVGHTVQELEDGTLETYNKAVDQIFRELEGMVTESYTQLDEQAGITKNIDPLIAFANNMTFMGTALDNAQKNASDLQQTLVNEIEPDLTTVKSDVINAINSKCPTDADCINMATRVDNVNIVVDYSNIDGSFTPLIMTFGVAISEGLPTKLVEGYESFKDVITDVNSSVAAKIIEAERVAQDLGHEISVQIDNIQEDLDSISFNGTIQDIQNTGDNIKEPTDYALYGMAGTAGLILLIVLLGYLGLLFGCCCPQPKPGSDGCCCTRKSGATCLLAGVGCTFIFFTLLMILLMLLMISGGLLHTELCRHLVSIDQSPVMAIIDDVMNETLFEDAGFYVNISDIYTNCRDDEAFYTALNVEETFGFDLDTILDVSAIQEEIENIRKQNITLDPINILSSDALSLLTELAKIVDNTTGKIDDANDELRKNVASEDLAKLAEDLEAFNQDQGGIPGLPRSIAALRDVKDGIDDMNDQKNITAGELTKVNYILDKTNLTALVIGLEEGNDTINNQGAEIIDSYIDSTTYQVESFISEAVRTINDSVRNDIGRCAPVYNAYSILVDSGCVEILYPLNGYWFALGWSLFFLIVGLIMSLELATLYRRTYRRRNAVHPQGTYDKIRDGYK